MPCRSMARTAPFEGVNTGSSPVEVTMCKRCGKRKATGKKGDLCRSCERALTRIIHYWKDV